MTPSQPREEGEETILTAPVLAEPTSKECFHPRTEVVASGEARESTEVARTGKDDSRGGQIHSGSAAPTGSSPSVSGEKIRPEDWSVLDAFFPAGWLSGIGVMGWKRVISRELFETEDDARKWAESHGLKDVEYIPASIPARPTGPHE